jgi:hypothetical protein
MRLTLQASLTLMLATVASCGNNVPADQGTVSMVSSPLLQGGTVGAPSGSMTDQEVKQLIAQRKAYVLQHPELKAEHTPQTATSPTVISQ